MLRVWTASLCVLVCALGGEGGPQSISLIPPWLMLGALAFSTLIGTLAGLLPAVRASRLSPLAAIRSQ